MQRVQALSGDSEMKISPTQRTLKLLRERGYLCAVVERFVRFPFPGHRVDLWGIGDILAVKPGETLLVQCTTTGVAERVTKIVANPNTIKLLAVPWRIAVWGWRKVGPRGKRKTWECREVPLTAGDFDQEIPT